MAYQQRDNTGAIFANDRKEKDTQPDFKGECLIGGVAYEIGGWYKEAKTGRKFTSLSFKVKSATYRTEPREDNGYKNPNPTYEPNSKPPQSDFDSLPF